MHFFNTVKISWSEKQKTKKHLEVVDVYVS